MAISLAINEGPTPIGGLAQVAIGTITWDASCLVTGEPIPEMVNYFSTVKAIIEVGISAIELAGYPAKFIFDPDATVTAANVLATLARVPLLEINDTVDIAAQALAVADAVDIASLGTTQIMIFGMPLA